MARAHLRAGLVGTAALLLALSGSPGPTAHASSQGQGLPGTWFVSVPGGLTGFYTYHQDGTLTGMVSTSQGAPPQPPGDLLVSGGDHGVWRQTGGGFEAVVFRMRFSPATGDPLFIIRIRTFFSLDPGRESTSGSFLVDQWNCPNALSCPDPNTTPPDVPDISPPPPFDTFTQTRVPLPGGP